MHNHAKAIDRIGRKRVQGHFSISDRSMQVWRKEGVPSLHHNTLRLLAIMQGVQVPELDQPR